MCLGQSGEVSEWLKEHAWKVCILERVSRVRIPSSPPDFIITPAAKAAGFSFVVDPPVQVKKKGSLTK